MPETDAERVERAIRRRWYERLLSSRPPLTDEDVLGLAVLLDVAERLQRNSGRAPHGDAGLRDVVSNLVPRLRHSLRRAGWVRDRGSDADDALRAFAKWRRLAEFGAREFSRIARTMPRVTVRSRVFRGAWIDFARTRAGAVCLLVRESHLLVGDGRRRDLAHAVERRRAWPGPAAVLPGERDRFVPLVTDGVTIRVPRPGCR